LSWKRSARNPTSGSPEENHSGVIVSGAERVDFNSTTYHQTV
jgi:hypothetical protein